MARGAFAAPRHVDEDERLQLLYRGRVLGMLDDEQLGDLAEMTCRLTGAAAAWVSVLDEHEAVVLAATGSDVAALPREQSATALVVQSAAPLLVGDLAADPRTADLVVLQEEGYRSCAAVPLADATGATLGAVVALDPAAAAFDADTLSVLDMLARQAWTVLSWRQSRTTLGGALQARRARDLAVA